MKLMPITVNIILQERRQVCIIPNLPILLPSFISFQVVWINAFTVQTTWKQESNVPSKLVEQYKNGILVHIEESFSSGGQKMDHDYCYSI